MSKDSLEVKSPSPPGLSRRLQKEGCGGELQGSAARLKREPL